MRRPDTTMVTATAAPAASKHWPASIYRRPDGGVEQGLSPARLREIQQKLFEEFDEGLIHEIFKGKRSTFALRRHIGPLREVLNILTNRPCGYIRPETQLYYRDVYDHNIRLMESVDTTRDLLAGVLETYLSQTSNRMNRVMKQLSIVATVALPLIVIAGIYGMNFSRMPLVHDPLGFWVAVASMVIVSLVIVWWLNRRKWL